MLLVEVPHDTDLNHYFEIMNTRGEQLEQHEILKTRMYSELSDPAEKAMLVKIWNSCMNMGRYIQVGLTKGKTEKRDKIFGDNWDEFVPKDFDDLCGLFNPVAESNTEEEMSIFDEKATDEMSNDDKDDEDLDNFQHLITFPSLLMHCGNLMENDMEGDLNDGKLLNYFSQKNPDKNYVKKFAYTLLKARFYLDNYMIHREKDNQEEDEFVIKRGHRTDAGNFTSKNTFSNKDDDESYNDETTRKVIMIQSCLRVSYTSPKQMYWITDLLKTMFEYHTAEKIIQTCENYFRDKLRDYFEDKSYCSNINFRQAYQKLPRIIYFYLDYLLWRDGYSVSGISINEEYKGKFRFIFRSPIDHFEPLDSSESYKYEESPEETQWKHSFGNLSCITTSLNFQGKADRNIIFSDEQLLQSPKLYIMAKIKMAKIKEKNAYKFDRNEAKEHGEKMFNILLNNLKP
jgi:hypothetical protein